MLHTPPMSQPAAPPPPSVPYGPDPSDPGQPATFSPDVTAKGVGNTAVKWGLRILLPLLIRAIFRAIFRR